MPATVRLEDPLTPLGLGFPEEVQEVTRGGGDLGQSEQQGWQAFGGSG